MLGVPGLMSVYKAGNVALANAPGTGVADDKVVYAYVPRLIKYYFGEDAILPNVPTYICDEEADLKYVLENLPKLAVKAANQSGGYGLIMGNKIGEEEWQKAKVKIEADARNYIAQPIIRLSTVPCFLDGRFEPRHVDLRPYALYGPNGIEIVPGGLTRVALKQGSLVVNSSQGGGSKDTWIVD